MEYIIVDGYNVIGASPELTKLRDMNLEEARYQLQGSLAEYSAYTGRKAIVVYDAHMTKGPTSKSQSGNLEICFTKEGITADQYIERLVIELIRQGNKVHVATSDAVEQHLVFGKGALRLSARELLIEMKMMRDEIATNIENSSSSSMKLDRTLNPEIVKILEMWRRKQ